MGHQKGSKWVARYSPFMAVEFPIRECGIAQKESAMKWYVCRDHDYGSMQYPKTKAKNCGNSALKCAEIAFRMVPS